MEGKISYYVFTLTNDLHNSVAELYESMCDEEHEKSKEIINKLIDELRHVKSNLDKYEI